MRRSLRVYPLTCLAYTEALEQQQRDIQEIITQFESPYVLRLYEHPPVFTCGRAFLEGHLKVSEEELNQRGIELHEVSRGGSITYHGPGQLVAYLHVDIKELEITLSRYLRELEEWVIRFLSLLSLKGERVKGKTGVWVRGAKVCAMGIAAKKFITWHGLSINIDVDPSCYDLMVPCGLSEPVGDLRSLGHKLSVERAARLLLKVMPDWLRDLERA